MFLGVSEGSPARQSGTFQKDRRRAAAEGAIFRFLHSESFEERLGVSINRGCPTTEGTMMAVWDKLILLRSGNAGWSIGDAQTGVTLEHATTTSAVMMRSESVAFTPC